MKKIINIILNAFSSLLFPISCAVCKKSGECLCANCEEKLELNNKDTINNKNFKKDFKNNFSNIPGKINDWTYAKYKYQNKYLKKIEYAIKYNHHPKLAETMGEYSYDFIYKNIILKNIDAASKARSENIYLIPIPISQNRLKERGYNQTEYISKGILNESIIREDLLKDDIENKTKTNIQILDIFKRENTKKLKDVYGVDNRSEEIRNSMNIDELKLKDFLLKNKFDNLGGGYAATLLKNKDNIFILIDDITTSGATFYEARRVLIHYGIIEKNIYGYALAH